MPTASMNQTLEDLQPHLNSIRQFALKAWRAYHDELSERALTVFCSRTRASGVHNFMVEYAAEFVAANDRMHMFKRRSMRGLIIDGKYAIRFKKLDEENRSSNQPSAQVRDFREQRCLTGIDAVHNFELGYILDSLQREVIDVRLVYPSGQGTTWAVSILENATKSNVSDIFESMLLGDDENKESGITPSEIVPRESAEILPFSKEEGR